MGRGGWGVVRERLVEKGAALDSLSLQRRQTISFVQHAPSAYRATHAPQLLHGREEERGTDGLARSLLQRVLAVGGGGVAREGEEEGGGGGGLVHEQHDEASTLLLMMMLML